MCFDNLIRYFFISPVLVVIIISLLPLLIFPKETEPSTSDTTAGFEGFLPQTSQLL